jgi:membrane protease subunit HflK
MEQVLGESNMVLLDVPDGNSLMYLPLDQLMKQNPPQPRTSMVDMTDSTVSSDSGTVSTRVRDTSRERRSR